MIGRSIGIFRFVNHIMFGGGVQLNIYLETVVVVIIVLEIKEGTRMVKDGED